MDTSKVNNINVFSFDKNNLNTPRIGIEKGKEESEGEYNNKYDVISELDNLNENEKEILLRELLRKLEESKKETIKAVKKAK